MATKIKYQDGRSKLKRVSIVKCIISADQFHGLEIAASLMAIQVAGEVSWDDFLVDSRSLILSSYEGQDPALYKQQWRTRFLNTASLLKFSVQPDNKNSWSDIETSLQQKPSSSQSSPSILSRSSKSTKSSSVSSTSSNATKNCALSPDDILNIMAQYDAIPVSDKWILKTGKVVEDTMRSLAIICKYEHPVHSLILDPSDDTWKDYFTEDELNEIRTCNSIALPSFPLEYQQYLDKYDQDLTAKEIYQRSCNHCFDPIEEHDKKWMQQSVMMAANLFLYNNRLQFHDFSESDLLHKVWPFIYHLFDDDNIQAKLGEQCSSATTKRKNSKRRLEAVQARQNKVMGSRMDILFVHGNKELGCVEVGKQLTTNMDDKYMDDGMIKMPKSLRDMLSCLVQKNPDKINNVAVIGYLIMGK